MHEGQGGEGTLVASAMFIQSDKSGEFVRAVSESVRNAHLTAGRDGMFTHTYIHTCMHTPYMS